MRRCAVRLFLLAAVIALFIAAMSGCSKNAGEETSFETTAETEATTVTTKPADLGGYEFIIKGAVSLNPESSDVRDTELGDELKAIFEDIEKTYNCRIKFSNLTSDYMEQLTAVDSGVKYADFVNIKQSSWIPLLVQGALLPLEGSEMADAGLDVNDADCFYQPYTHLTDFTFAGETHTWGVDLSGKYTRLDFGYIFAFNKGLLESNGYGAESVFNLVYNGRWTYEKMLEIAEAISEDTDEDGCTDIYGIALDCDGGEAWSNGTSFLKYDAAADRWKANLNDDGMLPALSFMRDENAVDKRSWNSWEPMGRGDYRRIFFDGKAAFAGMVGQVFAGLNYAEIETSIGIVPIPRGPDAVNYHMVIIDVNAYCMPSLCGDRGKAAFIMGKIGEAVHDDGQYCDYLRNTLGGCEDSFKVLTQYLLPTLNMAKCSTNMYDIVRKELFREVFNGSLAPENAAAEYNTRIQAELDSLFGQS